jgi:hypothetical protein
VIVLTEYAEAEVISRALARLNVLYCHPLEPEKFEALKRKFAVTPEQFAGLLSGNRADQPGPMRCG